MAGSAKSQLLNFPALALILSNSDISHYEYISANEKIGGFSSADDKSSGFNSSLSFNGATFTAIPADSSVEISGSYSSSLVSIAKRDSGGLANSFITNSIKQFDALVKKNPSAEVICIDFSGLFNSKGALKNLSTPVKFVSNKLGSYTSEAYARRQFTITASSLTSPWINSDLWLIEGIGKEKTNGTSSSSEGVLLFSQNGLHIADSSSDTGIWLSRYSTEGASNFNALDSRASSALEVIPQCSIYLGTPQADILTGISEDEVFIPLGGKDKITMGGGKDLLVLASAKGNPTVTDFSVEDDKIFLDNNTFGKLGKTVGSLDAKNFVVGNPKDANDFISYDQGTGGLFYDTDGNGKGAAIQIATFGTTVHPVLTASNFIIG